MMLALLIAVLILGGVAAWAGGRQSARLPRRIALGTLVAAVVLLAGAAAGPAGGPWMAEVRWAWVPSHGIALHLALDGLSLLLVGLSLFLGIVAVGIPGHESELRPGLYHLCLLWILAGVTGVFLAMDLFLFYLFWEVMLVPMVLLIGIWGHARRIRAAAKFFIFTQAGGLLLLVAIVALYHLHGRATGNYTFGIQELTRFQVPEEAAPWLLTGFLAAFLVKLPAVPLHTWLPDAHTEAPTAGSVLLAGLLLKTGAYGLLRLALPLFPEAIAAAAPWLMGLGAAGIVYGALLAFAQSDLKRLVAYSSVSHMGFVLLGAVAGSRIALQGVVVQILCHGFSTGALFLLAGCLQERFGTRELDRLGGLWPALPRAGGFTLFFALASLGLPGLGNFVGEFLVLLGAYRENVPAAVVATAGLVPAAVYALWIVQRVFHGRAREAAPGRDAPRDLGLRETALAAALVVPLVVMGVYPRPVLDTADSVLLRIERVPEAGR